MRNFVRLCEEYADRFLRLADECQTDRARRFFKLLAVDLLRSRASVIASTRLWQFRWARKRALNFGSAARGLAFERDQWPLNLGGGNERGAYDQAQDCRDDNER